MSIAKYYKTSILYPSLFVLVFTIVYSIIDNFNYKSEWLTAESVMGMSIMFAFLYCLIISILALTQFFCSYQRVRSNLFLLIICWFLAPIGFITAVIFKELNFRLKYNSGHFDSDLLYILVLNIPFIVGIALGFRLFIRTITFETIAKK